MYHAFGAKRIGPELLFLSAPPDLRKKRRTIAKKSLIISLLAGNFSNGIGWSICHDFVLADIISHSRSDEESDEELLNGFFVDAYSVNCLMSEIRVLLPAFVVLLIFAAENREMPVLTAFSAEFSI